MSLPWQVKAAPFRDLSIEKNVACKMRDGVILYADIYKPAAAGKWPVLLMSHPYDKTHAEMYALAHPSWYARYGYMVIVQDSRGRWKSEGEWHPFVNEQNDGYDTVTWASRLPDCNGKVATYGYSYAGENQLWTAISQPEGLTTIMPAMCGSNLYDGWNYRGGAFQQAMAQSWLMILCQDTCRRRGDYLMEEQFAAALRISWMGYWTLPGHNELFDHGIAPYYREWLEHDTNDEFWKSLSVAQRYQDILVPALHIGGWYDPFIEGTLENFRGLKERSENTEARSNQKLVVGPWYHNPWHPIVGQMDFGENALNPIDSLQMLWLDKHLKGQSNQLDQEPPVALFVMGENKWRFENDWPLPDARQQKFFLHSLGRANSISGDGWLDQKKPSDELNDTYVYDPRNPVLSMGGHSCCVDVLSPMGAFDQRSQECRNDVLLYSTAALPEDLQVIGTVRAIIYAASSAVDTDFTAKLVDVYPDGRAINILEGIIRARFRESFEQPQPLEPETIYKFDILLGSTAIVFKAGHRLRLEVSSSNFPAFDRNSNSGKRLIDTTYADWVVATQNIFHDSRYPSHLSLPIV